VLHGFGARAIDGIGEIELEGADEPSDRLFVLEVEPIPIDDRSTTEQEPNRFELRQRELVQGFQADFGLRRDGGSS
jgi:hypothetical protein